MLPSSVPAKSARWYAVKAIEGDEKASERLALPASECLSFATALVFIVTNARRYGYDGRPALLIREG